MVDRLPTFLGIGAAKCGTTALHRHLHAHPEVAMSLFKEPEFFNTRKGLLDGGDADGPSISGHYARGTDWYRSLFRGAEQAAAVGEISTQYFVLEESPRLIHEMLPGVKLILCLREPLKRIVSHYWEERRGGLDLPPLQEMPGLDHPRWRYYLRVSDYQQHIERYLAYFQPADILVMILEEFQRNPEQHMQRVYRFVGVDEAFVPVRLDETVNPSMRVKSSRLQRWLVRLASLRWRWSGVYWLYRAGALPGRWLIRWNTHAASRDRTPAELCGNNAERFTPTIQFVESFIGRELPVWRTRHQ